MRTLAVALAVTLVTAGSSTAAFVVTSKNIKNGTIQLADISPRAKAALRGRSGPQGPPGISSITEATAVLTFLPNGRGNAVATCPTGLAPISGGYISGSIVGNIVVEVSRPDQLTLHEELIRDRNKVYAHTDEEIGARWVSGAQWDAGALRKPASILPAWRPLLLDRLPEIARLAESQMDRFSEGIRELAGLPQRVKARKP